MLDRTRGKRKFRRLTGAALTQLLPASHGEPEAEPAPADTPRHDLDDSRRLPTEPRRPSRPSRPSRRNGYGVTGSVRTCPVSPPVIVTGAEIIPPR